MVVSKRIFREILFQAFYALSFSEKDNNNVDFFNHLSKDLFENVKEKISCIFENLEKIDDIIKKFSYEYDFNRISSVEKTILRVSLFEILYDNVPVKVGISEAIRLCRKFGSNEGGNFVNAVLDAIYKSKIVCL